MAAEDLRSILASQGLFWSSRRPETKRKALLSVHTPTFDIDESALETGACWVHAWLAIRELNKPKTKSPTKGSNAALIAEMVGNRNW